MRNHITIKGQDGAFAAYIARPAAVPAPAVIVLHELFGVNADIRETCNELAQQGLIAVAPDLFWRQEPGVDLGVRSEPDWQHGLGLYQAYDRDAGVNDIKEVLVQIKRFSREVYIQRNTERNRPIKSKHYDSALRTGTRLRERIT
jgi:carboxymethylenebutenolidase